MPEDSQADDPRVPLDIGEASGPETPPALTVAPALSRGPALREAIAAVRRARLDIDFRLESRRNRLGGVLIFGKRLLRPLMRWYLIGVRDQLDSAHELTARAFELMANRLEQLEHQQARSGERLIMLQRRLDELASSAERGGTTPGAPHSDPREATAAVERALDYVGFEDHFRGSVEEITRRQRMYVELFQGAPGRAVDLGCGRGEFLGLMREAGIENYGVDSNPGMVEQCAAQGLEVVAGDVTGHLASLAPASLGGIFCAQVLEHLAAGDVIAFFDLARRALRPGGRLVVETLNPTSLSIFAGALYVDPGHTRPLHPLTLQYLARGAGFENAEVRYVSPLSDDERLVELSGCGDERVDASLERLNENLRRLNRLLFAPQDFALIATA